MYCQHGYTSSRALLTDSERTTTDNDNVLGLGDDTVKTREPLNAARLGAASRVLLASDVAPDITRRAEGASKGIDAVVEVDSLDAVGGSVGAVILHIVKVALGVGLDEGDGVGSKVGDDSVDQPVGTRVGVHGRERSSSTLVLGDIVLDIKDAAALEDIAEGHERLGCMLGKNGEAWERVDVCNGG